MLGHLVLVDDLAYTHTNVVLASMFAELDVRANALQSLANIVEHCFCCGLLLDDSEAKLIVANIEIEMFGDLLGDELV